MSSADTRLSQSEWQQVRLHRVALVTSAFPSSDGDARWRVAEDGSLHTGAPDNLRGCLNMDCRLAHKAIVAAGCNLEAGL